MSRQPVNKDWGLGAILSQTVMAEWGPMSGSRVSADSLGFVVIKYLFAVLD